MDQVLPRIAALLVLAPSALALADNSPEKAERNAQDEYVAKINDVCELSLSMRYDGASLRAHDEFIEHDQDDGSSECNEALRLLWYACRTPAGKAAAQKARIKQVVCKGASRPSSSFKLDGRTLTLERGERLAYARLRKSFEALFHVTVRLGPDAQSPDTDEAWKDLRYAPNPTRSTTDYCLVNGDKQEFDSQLRHRFRGEDGSLECWKAGQKVADLRFKQGFKTGFYTESDGGNDTVFSYRDDKRDGENKKFRNGKLAEIYMFERDKVRWSKEFHPSGKVKVYSHRLAHGWVGYRQGEDGRIYTLDCAADVGTDPQLRRLCGFEGEFTVSIYDGTEQVDRVETWKNGVLQERGAGDSAYAERSSVTFAGGKKHGIERVLAADGTLTATITWKNGVKEGPEVEYAEGGTKRTKETLWSAGRSTRVTEFYLNGNRKQREVYVGGDQRKQFQSFWDTGKVRRQGDLVRCGRNWCEHGPFRTYFESGATQSDTMYQNGKLVGLARSWWPNGQQATREEYADGRRVSSARWDEAGTLIANEEYEADGSRKLGR